MKINRPLLFVGIALSLGAVALLLFAGQLLNPPPMRIPVAAADIPAGTALDRTQFRLEEWSGLEVQTQNALYGTADFPLGAITLVDVPAGSPLYKAYVDTEQSADFVVRLTNLVKDQGLVVMAIPVKPDTGGNIPVNGDQVDLVFSIGAIQAEFVQSHPTPTPSAPSLIPAESLNAEAVTQTLPLPLSALILENIPVLRVEREKFTTQGGGYDSSAPTVIEGDAQRLYVAVTREQAEALAFLLHNGDILLAVHAAGLQPQYPGGVTWQDFESRFFDRRPTPQAREVP